MRHGLRSMLAAVAVASYSLTLQLPAGAQQTPPTDTESWGDLIGDGAEVGAFDPGSAPTGPGGGGGGGGQAGSEVTCELRRQSGTAWSDVTAAQLQQEYDATGGQPVRVARTCRDANGQVIADDLIDWTPAVGDPVSPEWLAERARERLVLPHPQAQMAPAPEVGTTAQLPTYFWLTNWPDEPLWQEASAGGVTARVTATPVRQTWRVSDAIRDETATQNCGATPGVVYDPANPEAAGSCSWRPTHSSAGQPERHPITDEPCFDASVTVYWSLVWDSNITAEEPLGTVPMTSTACIVVHEIQAVVSES